MKCLNSYIHTHHALPIDIQVEDIDNFIDSIDSLGNISLSLYPNTVKASSIKKGVYNGEKFDSKWEAIVYIYYKKIQNVPCERNSESFVIYYDRQGKERKFFPDFLINGSYVEVKGRYRELDLLKKEQHPEIMFIDSTSIKPLKEAVDKAFPSWKQDYLIF